MQIVSVTEGPFELEDKVKYALLLGQCCRTKREFVSLLEALTQGMMGKPLQDFLMEVKTNSLGR